MVHSSLYCVLSKDKILFYKRQRYHKKHFLFPVTRSLFTLSLLNDVKAVPICQDSEFLPETIHRVDVQFGDDDIFTSVVIGMRHFLSSCSIHNGIARIVNTISLSRTVNSDNITLVFYRSRLKQRKPDVTPWFGPVG